MDVKQTRKKRAKKAKCPLLKSQGRDEGETAAATEDQEEAIIHPGSCVSHFIPPLSCTLCAYDRERERDRGTEEDACLVAAQLLGINHRCGADSSLDNLSSSPSSSSW